jgi:hypothetical protein
MLSCSTNIFFALSGTDLTISSTGAPVASDCKGTDGEVIAHGGVTISPSTSEVIQSGVKSSGGGGAIIWLGLLLMGAGLIRKAYGAAKIESLCA